MHPDMARLLRLAHEMADGCTFGHLEIEIDLHAAVVGVRRHGVPGAARSEFGHTHLQLAAGHHLLDQQAVDCTFVALFEASQMHHHGIFLGHLLHSSLLVGGGGAEVEVGWFLGGIALESDVAVSAAHIQGFLVFEMILFLSYHHGACTADIDDAELAALGEIVGTENLRRAQKQVFFHRHRSSGNDAVEHGVDHVDLIGHHDILHEVFLADTLGVVVFRIDVARCLSYLAIDLHILFRLFSNIGENPAVYI